MNELSIFITGLLFSCAVGSLVGSIFAISIKRIAGRVAVIAIISGLCALVIGAAFGLRYVVGNNGFIGYVCNLLIAPWVYIGIFAGWNIYSFILGAIIQTGLMTLAGGSLGAGSR